MSLGVLCIIVIPTEDEEFKLQQLNRKKFNLETTPLTSLKPQTPQTPTTPITSIITEQQQQQQRQHIDGNNQQDKKILESQINKNQYDTFDKVNTSLYNINKNSKITGIDNQSFETDMEINSDDLKNKRNKNSEDDVKKSYNSTNVDNSTQSSKNKLNTSSLFLDLPTESAMYTVLKEILKKLKVENISWDKIRDDKYYQVIFTMECDIKYENLQIMLNEWGIGHRKGSTVSITNCSFNSYKNEKDDRKDSTATEYYPTAKNGIWDRFMNNFTARLNVAQIVRDVRQDATITFDFTILVISAAVLASFGLVENSTIFLASSMLISPLMGPIIAGIFGTVIKDGSLTVLGVVNELIGLFMATLVGFVFGLIVCGIKESYNILDDGLTIEMMSRTSLHSVAVGVITATVSGAAAAVGILGGNVGSLVGVAISASLLPPAVNAGLLWALSCIYITYVPGDESKIHTQIGVYSDNLASELGILGLISMLLTISNIACVYLVGVIILKIKEVAPIVSNKHFWRHDIKIARDYNRNGSIFIADPKLANEYASLPQNEQNVIKCLNSLNIDDLPYQKTWSPTINNNNNNNLQDLEKYYSTVDSSRTAGGRANSISVEQIRNHLNDFSNYMRRASMPFEVLTRSPKTKRSMKTLPTIPASIYEISPTSTLNKSTKSKFSVTSVHDNNKNDLKDDGK